MPRAPGQPVAIRAGPPGAPSRHVLPAAQSAGPNYTVGTAVECQTSRSGSYVSDTLADVAAYYYKTDLRDSAATGTDATGTCIGPLAQGSTTVHNDLCENDVVKTNDRDVARGSI